MSALAGCLLLIVTFVAGTILRGWVLSVLWGWFVVPFFGLTMLSIPLALGISLLVGILTKEDTDCVKPERSTEEAWAYSISSILLGPLLVLLFGFIIHLFL